MQAHIIAKFWHLQNKCSSGNIIAELWPIKSECSVVDTKLFVFGSESGFRLNFGSRLLEKRILDSILFVLKTQVSLNFVKKLRDIFINLYGKYWMLRTCRLYKKLNWTQIQIRIYRKKSFWIRSDLDQDPQPCLNDRTCVFLAFLKITKPRL